MFSQTIALLLISITLVVIFVRKTSLSYAMAILPILVVPVGFLASFPLATLIANFAVSTPIFLIRVFVIVAFLAIACGCIGISAFNIPVKRIRIAYTVMLSIYCITLSVIYIRNIILVFLG